MDGKSLLEISGTYWQSCTLHAAVALDLFTAIGCIEKTAPALFALNMLQGAESGRAYSERQIREILAEAGVGDVRPMPVKGQRGIIGATI